MILQEYTIRFSAENLKMIVEMLKAGSYNQVAGLINDLGIQVGLQEQKADDEALRASVAKAGETLPPTPPQPLP